MATPKLQGEIDAASEIMAAWTSFVENLSSLEGPQREAFDLEKPIPNLSPAATIRQVETKLMGAAVLIQNLSKIQTLDLIPDSVVNELTTRVTATKATVDKLVQQISAFELDNPIASLDSAAMTAANQKGQLINLSPTFIELYPTIQTLLTSLYQLRSMSGLSDDKGYSLEFSNIDLARSAQRRTSAELNRMRRISNETRTQLDKAVADTRSIAREITKLKEESIASLAKTNEEKGKAEALHANIAEVHAKTEEIKQTTLQYEQTFADFGKKLSEREGRIATGEAQQTTLLVMLEDLRKEANRLQERSRNVLGEATMTGLTEGFAREKNSAGLQLVFTQLLFYLSIILLLLAAGVVTNLFPWLESWVRPIRYDPPASADGLTVGLFHLVNFLNKLIILVPPLLLLGFAAKRYAEMFRLKSLYTYKYTVAASLPGFKVEAPTYAEGITAAAFQELLKNPIDLDLPKGRHAKEGTTFAERLIEPIVKKTIDKMMDVKKVAE